MSIFNHSSHFLPSLISMVFLMTAAFSNFSPVSADTTAAPASPSPSPSHDQLVTQIQRLSQERTSLIQQINDLEKQVVNLELELELVDTHQSSNADDSSLIKLRQNVIIIDLQSKLDSLSHEHNSLVSSLSEKENQNKDLLRILSEWEQNFSVTQSQHQFMVRNLNHELQRLDENLQQSQAGLQEKQNMITRLEIQVQNLQQTIDSTTCLEQSQKIDADLQKISLLETQLGNTQIHKELAETRKNYEQATIEVLVLEKLLKENEVKLQSSNAALSSALERENLIRSEFHTLRVQLNSLQKNNADLARGTLSKDSTINLTIPVSSLPPTTVTLGMRIDHFWLHAVRNSDEILSTIQFVVLEIHSKLLAFGKQTKFILSNAVRQVAERLSSFKDLFSVQIFLLASSCIVAVFILVLSIFKLNRNQPDSSYSTSPSSKSSIAEKSFVNRSASFSRSSQHASSLLVPQEASPATPQVASTKDTTATIPSISHNLFTPNSKRVSANARLPSQSHVLGKENMDDTNSRDSKQTRKLKTVTPVEAMLTHEQSNAHFAPELTTMVTQKAKLPIKLQDSSQRKSSRKSYQTPTPQRKKTNEEGESLFPTPSTVRLRYE